MPIRILNAEPDNYSAEARSILLQVGELLELQLTRSQLIDALSEFDVLIVRLGLLVDREIIDAGTNLRVIVTATTGLDHIDVEYAKAKGIQVISLRGEYEFLDSVVATAEHTWGLILSLTRRIPWAFDSVRQGEWDRDRFRGNDLRGKRLGVLGLGRIGRKVAQYGLTFGMNVLAFDPYVTSTNDSVTLCGTLEEFLQQCDVLSIHVPLNQETSDMIGRDQITSLPKGSILVNTSRGGVINEEALLESLRSGHLGGVAVDVLTTELMSGADSPLVQYARDNTNLLITPHIGGATIEAMSQTEAFVARRLKSFMGQV